MRNTEGSDIRHAAHDSQYPDPRSLPSTAFLPHLPLSAPIQTLILPTPNQLSGFQTAGIIIISHAMSPSPVEPAPCPLPPTLRGLSLNSVFSWHRQLFSSTLPGAHPAHLPEGFSLPTSSVSFMLLLLLRSASQIFQLYFWVLSTALSWVRQLASSTCLVSPWPLISISKILQCQMWSYSQ